MSLVDIPPSSKRWVSLTPLIDVVFILIMFFMLTTQFDRKQALALSVLSDGQNTSSAQTDNDIARVIVINEGFWQFNGNQYSVNNTARMEELAKFKTVLVTAFDDDVVLQEVITLIDKLAVAGVKQVSWVTASTTNPVETPSQ